ncbi:hypothetical protein D3C87_1719950 [compost metagenome]
MIEVLLLSCGRQFPIKKQIAGFEEVTLFGKLLDRIAAMKKHAFVAVDIGDFRFTRSGRGKPGVVGEGPGMFIERADIDNVRTDRTGLDRQVDLLVTESESCACFRHSDPPTGWRHDASKAP